MCQLTRGRGALPGSGNLAPAPARQRRSSSRSHGQRLSRPTGGSKRRTVPYICERSILATSLLMLAGCPRLEHGHSRRCFKRDTRSRAAVLCVPASVPLSHTVGRQPSVSPTFHTCACDDACSAFNGLPVIYRWSGVVPEVRCCPRCAAHASGPQQCGGNRIARTQRRSLQRVLHARTLPAPGGNAKGGEAGALEARRRCVVGEKPAAPMKQDVATSAEDEQRCCEQQHELAPAVGDLFLNHAGHHGGTACVQPRMPAWRFAGWRGRDRQRTRHALLGRVFNDSVCQATCAMARRDACRSLCSPHVPGHNISTGAGCEGGGCACQSQDGRTCSHLDVDAAWEQVMWNVFSHCSASVDAGACSHIRPASHRSHAAELPLPLAGVPCRPRTQQRSTERLPSPAVHCAAGARDTSECQLELALRVRSEPSPRALERLTRLSVAVQAIARAGVSAGPERQAFIPRLLVTNTTRRLPQATVEVAARCVLRALRVHF